MMNTNNQKINIECRIFYGKINAPHLSKKVNPAFDIGY